MTREAMLYERLEGNRVHCHLCSHHCVLAESKHGICGVRQNEGGSLHTHVYGEAIAANVDPIEKKPLYHFLPGSKSFSIATIGCNFQCGFCQNWQISQTTKREAGRPAGRLMPQDIISEAVRRDCRSISYTYTEPTVFFEYAHDTSRRAKSEALRNVFVTNGYMTSDALQAIGPYLDAANVDLKSFSEKFYTKTCKAHLQPVLDAIRTMKELGIWVEITTLVIPEENDSDDELGQIADFIAKLDPNTPWHLSRFHPDYKYVDHHRSTPLTSLSRAARIGRDRGLKYVYLGNVASDTDTGCSGCGKTLVQRTGYAIGHNVLQDESCPSCGTRIPGVWR